MHKCAKPGKYAYTSNFKIFINVCFNYLIQFYMHKYALYAGICIRINMPLYANLNMNKNAQNMHKYAKIFSDPISISPMHSYAFTCTKYAKICKIGKA